MGLMAPLVDNPPTEHTTPIAEESDAGWRWAGLDGECHVRRDICLCFLLHNLCNSELRGSNVGCLDLVISCFPS